MSVSQTRFGASALKRRNKLLEQENEILRRAAAYLSRANLKLGGSGEMITELFPDSRPRATATTSRLRPNGGKGRKVGDPSQRHWG